MKFGISAALIAFAFVGVSKCDVTVPITCPTGESDFCFSYLQEKYDLGMSDLLPFLEEDTQSINVATSGSDCTEIEDKVRKIAPEACGQCVILTEYCS